VLVTWDVDPDLWISLEDRQLALSNAMTLCQERDIRATFFVTARPAKVYAEMFQTMLAQGHEIGCHGLTHGDEENYDRMPTPMQYSYVSEATESLSGVLGRQVRAFRSPRVKTSADTLKILSEHGYLVDSSVCSQRLDLVSSNLINVGWVFAPRRPYHPSSGSAFRAGSVGIWEVPISAALMPFVSTTLRVFGLSMMKLFFRLLYAEARLTGKPIVYLAHPTEFLGSGETSNWEIREEFVKLEHLRPSYIRAHGFRARNLMYRVGGARLLDYTRELFDYISSFAGVSFMTMSEYGERVLRDGV
jgi:hypothetical protein